MLTTKDVKLKNAKNKKLTILTSNKIKPKEFEIKGKPAGKSVIVTTGNMKEFLAIRKEEIKIEDAAAKKRMKKLNEEIRVSKEKEKVKEEKYAGSIEKQLEDLDKKRKELEAKLGKK